MRHFQIGSPLQPHGLCPTPLYQPSAESTLSQGHG